ncbi:MAG TPA: PEP/pyruvate-binding domain-containing protein, partial [Actinomycetota bacterium]|nr:PEP/pyruvate-binding domain-containing protein [Actinomycetota bacterium]
MDLSISLDNGRAREPAVAGAKAAGLALARAAGLPVLPGWIVPTHLAAPAADAGLEALRRTGAPSATRAVHAVPVGEPLLRDLERIARRIGRDAIVRSSAPQEGDPAWAGAFASYVEVTGADLATAVRGCWASAFARDALARCRALGVDPRAVRVAVLIQPWTPFEAGGTARVDRHGRVAVSAAPGWPGALAAGRVGGWDLVVSRHNEVAAGGSRGTGVDVWLVRDVAALARAAREATGHPVIEWGARGNELTLLQVRSTRVRRVGASDRATTRRRAAPRPLLGARGDLAERLAVLAARFGGPLGDRLVLPWALAADPLPAASDTAQGDPAAAVAEARELSRRLTAAAWGLPPGAASAAAS